MPKTAFVTVGTTEFDLLIRTLCSKPVLGILENIGVENLVVQFGRGITDPRDIWPCDVSLHLESYRYKATLAQDIARADLVIGHAGAGTCLECLEAGKLLLVVSNDQLHDRHQSELADRFADLGFLLHCVPETLADTLREFSTSSKSIRPYQPGNPKLFADWLIKELVE